jgi:hypothetical protein
MISSGFVALAAAVAACLAVVFGVCGLGVGLSLIVYGGATLFLVLVDVVTLTSRPELRPASAVVTVAMRLRRHDAELIRRVNALSQLRRDLSDAPPEDLAQVDAAILDLRNQRRQARGALARLAAAHALHESQVAMDLLDARAHADAMIEIVRIQRAA